MSYPGRHSNQPKTRAAGKRFLLPTILAIALLVLTGIGGGVARYSTQLKLEPAEAGASRFHFTSDYLSEGDGSSFYQVCNNLSAATIDFELYNFKDELNVSETAISYTVNYKLRTSSQYTRYATGTLPVDAGGKGTSAKISLPVGDLNPSGSRIVVDVEVNATSPYVKTLFGSFTLEKTTASSVLSVHDYVGSNIAQVTVTTGSSGGAVTVTAPEGYFPDPTNYLPDGLTISGRSITFQSRADGEYGFRFLKTNPNDIKSDSDFTLS